jgi:hypothetical protein
MDLHMTRKKTEEGILEEEKRTTPLGLFNYAEAYWSSAIALQKAEVKNCVHWDSPVRFLYYHAIELYLKAFLRHKMLTLDELKKLGHPSPRLTARAEQLGLVFDDEDKEVFATMFEKNIVNRSRYIQTGSGTWPTLEALNRTCKSLRGGVGDKLFR